jgi:hypothetical protein
MNRVDASKTLYFNPDLVNVDGNHTKDAVYEDLCPWYPFIE